MEMDYLPAEAGGTIETNKLYIYSMPDTFSHTAARNEDSAPSVCAQRICKE